MKVKRSPRAKVKNWVSLFNKVQKFREKGDSLEVACVRVGIAYSTYHLWKRRLEAND